MSETAPERREAGGEQASSRPHPLRDLRRHRTSAALSVVVAVAFVYVVLPRLAGLGSTLQRLRSGDAGWLAAGVVLEAGSLLGETALIRGIFARPGNGIGWTSSAEITFAGAAATKLVSAAGAGGIAMTVWALRGYGLSEDEVADGMACYEILTYAVYMLALAIAGYGLWFGLFSGPAPRGLTLVPAIFATVVIVLALSMLVVDEPATRWLERRAERSSGKAAERWQRAAKLPRAVHAGLVGAIAMIRRRDPSVLGAVAYWGFDIGTLWASYRAFGHSPPGAVLVEGYFVGTMANVLPWPGGVGGVESGMIGAFVGFHVKASLATIAVLAYRTISYWLPAIPGTIAYGRLRHTIGSEDDQASTDDQA